MGETHVNQIKKHIGKREEVVCKLDIYKGAVVNAMEKVTEFDSVVVKSNEVYLERLLEADKLEYDILKENMKKADTIEERETIRRRMAEMKKERYEKDTENKDYYVKQQTRHKNYTLQVLGSIGVLTGLVVKYRKPIMNLGKKLITKS